MTTPNPDRRIGEAIADARDLNDLMDDIHRHAWHGAQIPTYALERQEKSSESIRRAKQALREHVAARLVAMAEKCKPATDTESHLRAQLAEAEKWRDWHELQAQRIMIQRDAAQARVAALEPVLVKAKERLLFWKEIAESHGLGHQETCGVCKMIDAALATSPHRLAGRGET